MSPARRRSATRAPLAAAVLVLVSLVSACGATQNATVKQEQGVTEGVNAEIGNIKVADLYLAAPTSDPQRKLSTAALNVSLLNLSGDADALTSIRSADGTPLAVAPAIGVPTPSGTSLPTTSAAPSGRAHASASASPVPSASSAATALPITIPAGGAVAIAPGTPMAFTIADLPGVEVGSNADLVLTFRTAGDLHITVPVVPYTDPSATPTLSPQPPRDEKIDPSSSVPPFDIFSPTAPVPGPQG